MEKLWFGVATRKNRSDLLGSGFYGSITFVHFKVEDIQKDAEFIWRRKKNREKKR